MTKKANTRLVIAAISLAVAGSLAATPAMAHKRHGKKHHHRTHHSRSHSSSSYSSSSYSGRSDADAGRVDALEAQVRSMQDEMSSLRASAGQASGGADTAKVQELDTWMQESKSNGSAPGAKSKDNMVFFRGGFARNDVKRDDLLTGNQFAGNALGGGRTNKDGWYVGAGFDFGLTDDVWGLADNTEIDAELMFEYKNFGAKNFHGAAPGATHGTVGANPACTLINLAAVDSAGAPGLAGTANCKGVTVSQLTVSAAPKIKFMKGSAFRPWIIPIGLALHVISPPSNGVTVLNPGMMFAAGAEYKLWKDITLGGDVRYHLTGRSVDGVNTDGLTAGGYLGIGF